MLIDTSLKQNKKDETHRGYMEIWNTNKKAGVFIFVKGLYVSVGLDAWAFLYQWSREQI